MPALDPESGLQRNNEFLTKPFSIVFSTKTRSALDDIKPTLDPEGRLQGNEEQFFSLILAEK